HVPDQIVFTAVPIQKIRDWSIWIFLQYFLASMLLRHIEGLIRVHFKERHLKRIAGHVRILGAGSDPARSILRLDSGPYVRPRTALGCRSKRSAPQECFAILALAIQASLGLKLVRPRVGSPTPRRDKQLLEGASPSQRFRRLRLFRGWVRSRCTSRSHSQRQQNQREPFHKSPLLE